MSNVGDRDEFIDTQGVALTNVTDNKEYIQSLTVTPVIAHGTDFNQLTNDTIDKLFSLTDPKFLVSMVATTTEFAQLLALTVPIAATLTSKTWKIDYTDAKNGKTTLTGIATISNMRPVDAGAGDVILEFVLDFTTMAVS